MMESTFRSAMLRTILTLLFLLPFAVSITQARIFKIKNETTQSIDLVLFCSDGSSFRATANPGELTTVHAGPKIISIMAEGIVINLGETKAVALSNGVSVLVAFSRPNFAGVLENDCGEY